LAEHEADTAYRRAVDNDAKRRLGLLSCEVCDVRVRIARLVWMWEVVTEIEPDVSVIRMTS
jgi:hypothetical protein